MQNFLSASPAMPELPPCFALSHDSTSVRVKSQERRIEFTLEDHPRDDDRRPPGQASKCCESGDE